MTKSEQCYKAPKTKKNRLSKSEYKKFQEYVYNIGYCQICTSIDLDTPHHSKYGVYKDDKSLICICKTCHYEIHHGKKGVEMSKKEIQDIGDINWSNYEQNNR